MVRRVAISAVLVLGVVGAAAPSAEAQVQGRIRRVGLFEGSAPLVRSGNWSFVEIELSWQGNSPFEGELRADQTDRDGDVVTSVLDVALAPDGQWRPYEIYFVPNIRGGAEQIGIQLYDANGRRVLMLTDTGEETAELVSPFFNELPVDSLLVLDLTTRGKLPHAACLDSGRGPSDMGHPINLRAVRSLSPEALPSRWLGLEPVDAIVWDDADPSRLTQQQIDALLDWVKAGGVILVTSGKNWQSLASSPLASALPVKITGARLVREAQEFSEDIVKDIEYEGHLARQYKRRPIMRCEMAKLPRAIGIPAEAKGVPQIAFRNLLGRGSITFLGASLRELLPPPAGFEGVEVARISEEERKPEQERFVGICEKVVARNFLGLPQVRGYESKWGLLNYEDLFDTVRKSIGFREITAAFLIFAILFAVGYSFTATIGTYWYLKRRGWSHHCWTAFAAVSLGGIVVGIGMVWALRGVTTRLWQTTVIDAKAGADYGYGTCLFGVKTPDHTRLDMRLPIGFLEDDGPRRSGPLRGVPQSAYVDVLGSQFVTAENYRTAQAGSLLQGVPIRATLKQFQGSWNGPLGGTLDARLVEAKADEGRFGSGSYIRNNLGKTLLGCIILEGREEIAGESGLTLTRCLQLGTLPKEGPGSELDSEALRQRLYYSVGNTIGEDPREIPRLELRLTVHFKRWLDKVPGLHVLARPGSPADGRPLTVTEEYVPLLLLSIFDLLEVDQGGGKATILRSYGRSLDCTHQITKKTAILIGYTYEPAPAVLEVDGRKLIPEKSRTMYRFVIPVDRP